MPNERPEEHYQPGDPPYAVRPDDEEQQILDQESQQARRELHALLVAEAYEKVKVGLKSNLLEWSQRKTLDREKIRGGDRLQKDLTAAKLRVGLLDGLYANHTERLEASIIPAKDPVVADATGDST